MILIMLFKKFFFEINIVQEVLKCYSVLVVKFIHLIEFYFYCKDIDGSRGPFEEKSSDDPSDVVLVKDLATHTYA